ncbi:MAG: acyltransferase [Flavobacteriales bacterium]|jgi:acetyltransferase-like isoleucine patch superfamily enzyme
MKTITEDSPKKSLTNVTVGEDVKIFNFVNAYGCSIGDRTKVGAFVEIQKGAEVGKDCKISSHTFICEGVKIGNGVFIGHNVSFINDMFPKAINEEGSMQTDEDWELVKTEIKDHASIGTSVTILGGLTIGFNALIGAGSVVTKNIPDNAVAAGNPAKIIRFLK